MRSRSAALAILLAAGCGSRCGSDRGSCGERCPQGAYCQCDALGRVAVESYDRDDDGTVDLIRWRRYDARDRCVRVDDDDDADGRVDLRTNHSFDAAGQLLSEERIEWANGSIDGRTRYEYDETGNLVKKRIRDEGEGTVVETTYRYDAQGRRLGYESLCQGECAPGVLRCVIEPPCPPPFDCEARCGDDTPDGQDTTTTRPG